MPPKRKEIDDTGHMPPMKKFKPMESKSAGQINGTSATARPQHTLGRYPGGFVPNHPLANGNSRQSLTNGPTLSPQGQFTPVGQSMSSQRPVQWQQPTPNLSQPNGHGPDSIYSRLPSLPSPTNHSSPSSQPQRGVAQQPVSEFQTPRQNMASFQSIQNPYTNSFGRQPASPRLPSPLNGPTLSPPSQQRPGSSHQHPQQPHHTPDHGSAPLTNGNTNGTAAPLLPSPAPFPPVKHDTPHTSPTLHHSQRISRSPVAQPLPPLQKPPSHPEAGISPVKQSPPRPGSGYASLQHTPAIAPPLMGAKVLEGIGVDDVESEEKKRRERERSPVKGGGRDHGLGLGLELGRGESSR